MLALLVDHDFSEHIVRAVEQRLPDLELLRARTAGLSTAPDSALLRWAAEQRRTIVTHDVSTMTAAAQRIVRRGGQHGGVIIVPQRLGIGVAAEQLWYLVQVMDQDEMRDQLVYLPL